ncbi:MAG: FAD-binding oxidoreductase [Archaeoglobaceae archaeon]
MDVQTAFSKFTKVEAHPEVLGIYRYDFSLIPKPLSKFVKKPLIVVQPSKIDELIRILEICERFELPIVPRGSATSAYGGCVPLEECVVVDFKRISNFEFRDNVVIAEGGAIWMEIERYANKIGKALRVYPTSASVSTVGGWIAQSGYGIGSLRYGGIGDNLEWIEVVDFKGLRVVKGEDLGRYVGAFGTTGLIARACIKLRENSEIRARAISCKFNDAVSRLESAYHATFKDSRLMQMEGYDAQDTLLLCSEDIEGNELGAKMWARRLTPLRVASKGKRVFSEVAVPYEKATDFYENAKRVAEGIEAIFSKDCVVFLGSFSAGYKNMIKALKFVRIAEKFGGKVYATGMLFSHKSSKELRDFKRKVDPKDLLNPRKLEPNVFSRIIGVLERFL